MRVDGERADLGGTEKRQVWVERRRGRFGWNGEKAERAERDTAKTSVEAPDELPGQGAKVWSNKPGSPIGIWEHLQRASQTPLSLSQRVAGPLWPSTLRRLLRANGA
eukprot:3579052-Pleurochrysis_carterae.AAC.1